MQKNLGNKGKPGRKFTRDMAFMRAVVREYETSDLSITELARKHALGTTQVQKWVAKFSSAHQQETLVPMPMTPEEQKQVDVLKRQNEELIKKLELANLKITGLEMMIDIAEDELKLDIRKKPGTKQLED